MLKKQPPEVFYKKSVLKSFAKFTGKHLRQSLFQISRPGLQLYRKRNSGTGVFLWILRNFYEHLFHGIPPSDCFFCSRNIQLWFLPRKFNFNTDNSSVKFNENAASRYTLHCKQHQNCHPFKVKSRAKKLAADSLNPWFWLEYFTNNILNIHSVYTV